MLDDRQGPQTSSSHLQRVRGAASVSLGVQGRATRLRHLSQAGAAKAFLPKSHTPEPEVVFLNTAGGLTGEDRLTYTLDLGAGGHVTATTQTAERAYASTGPAAQMAVDLTLGAGARMDWLPQETILFENAHLHRKTTAHLGAEASLLTCESVVLGRAAMGETLQSARLFDDRQIWRDGCPVVLEPLEISSALLANAPAAAGLSGHRAFATVTFVAQGAEEAATAIKALDLPPEVTFGASGWDGRCLVRLSAPDAFPLRRALVCVVSHLRTRPMPRVWQI